MSDRLPSVAGFAAERFFAALADCCNVTDAARRSGIAIQTVDQWARTIPGFSERWERSLGLAYDRLELELLERARFGNPDPKIYNDAHAFRMLARHRSEGQAISTAVNPGMGDARLRDIMARLRPAIEAREVSLEEAQEGGEAI